MANHRRGAGGGVGEMRFRSVVSDGGSPFFNPIAVSRGSRRRVAAFAPVFYDTSRLKYLIISVSTA